MDFDRLADHTPETVGARDREAAVVVPVVDTGSGRPDRSGRPPCAECSVLFTRRAEHLPDHPGQMSFPGGGREPEDEDLLATALREAREEVGLDADAVDVVGRLDDIETVSRYSVRPFVAVVPDRTYRPTDREVASVVTTPLTDLLDPDIYESERRDRREDSPVRLHFFSPGEFTVWGATARILVQLLELGTDWRTPQSPDRVVGPDAALPERVRDQSR